jgi:ABC-type Fe3+-hydroxamate transport system substrate-binding protein
VPHRLSALVGATLLALALAACGGESSDPAATSAAPTQTQSESVPAEAFPVTVEGDSGSLVVEQEPSRIVSLSSTATESLFAIGAGDQVIAVDDQSNFPADAPVTDLSGFQPNIEAIAGYEPDLVIAAYDPGGLVKGLEKVGIPVLLQDAAPDLDAAFAQIETLGAATGHVEEAQDVADDMKEQIDELIASAPDTADGATVYHELGPDFFSATSATFIGSIYERLGLENIADEAKKAGTGYPQLSAEYIVKSDPDLIVLADTKCCGQTAALVAKRPGWKGVAAVTGDDVVEASDDITSRWGPRTVDFVALVVEALEGVEAG